MVAVVVVDILWMYIYALGCQIEKSSVFGISKCSQRKTVGTQRAKNK